MRCISTPGERVVRGLLALFTCSVAVTTWSTNLWCAIPAAICATFLAVGAATGWCPSNLLHPRPPRAHGSQLDIPMALQPDLNRRPPS